MSSGFPHPWKTLKILEKYCFIFKALKVLEFGQNWKISLKSPWIWYCPTSASASSSFTSILWEEWTARSGGKRRPCLKKYPWELSFLTLKTLEKTLNPVFKSLWEPCPFYLVILCLVMVLVCIYKKQ